MTILALQSVPITGCSQVKCVMSMKTQMSFRETVSDNSLCLGGRSQIIFQVKKLDVKMLG